MSQQMFPSSTYSTRQQALIRQFEGKGLILLLGNDESSMTFRDNYYRFCQDSTFLYFFGLDLPGFSAVIDTDSGTVTIYGEEATIDHVIWMGPQPSLSDLAAAAGNCSFAPSHLLGENMAEARRTGRSIHTLPPYRNDHVVALSSLLDISPQKAGSVHSIPLIQAVIALRSVKSDEEIDQLEEASRSQHTCT